MLTEPKVPITLEKMRYLALGPKNSKPSFYVKDSLKRSYCFLIGVTTENKLSVGSVTLNSTILKPFSPSLKSFLVGVMIWLLFIIILPS
ncbi:hypothetical protein [Neobacillus sp. 19]|uniref:hypothetical protein n=1 Tax=Neobacillus sp. 19 TaxID=3394458 RepID=UPI003C2EFB3A